MPSYSLFESSTIPNIRLFLSQTADSSLFGALFQDSLAIPLIVTYGSYIDTTGKFILVCSNIAVNPDAPPDTITGKISGTIADIKWHSRTGSSKDYKLTLNQSADFPKFWIRGYSSNYKHKKIGEAFINFTVSTFDSSSLTKAKKSINETILKSMTSVEQLINSKEKFSDFSKIMELFIKRYERDADTLTKELPDLKLHYVYEDKLVPQWNIGSIITFQRYNFGFFGGAHGTYTYEFLNYDISSGEKILLSDVVNLEYKSKLDSIALSLLKEKFGLKPDMTLGESGFLIDDNNFKLTDNFALTPYGLIFQFNPYDIAPYAMGSIEIFIPKLKINNFLTADYQSILK